MSTSTYPRPPTPKLPASIASRKPHTAPPVIQRGRSGPNPAPPVPATAASAQVTALLRFRPSTKDVISGIAPHVFLDFDERRGGPARSRSRQIRRRRRTPSPECRAPRRGRGSPSPSPSRRPRRTESPLRRALMGVDEQGAVVHLSVEGLYTAALAPKRRAASASPSPKRLPVGPAHSISRTTENAKLERASKSPGTFPPPAPPPTHTPAPPKPERDGDRDIWKATRTGFRLDKVIKTFVSRRK
ncbi:hypothetical protein C8F01DRAFT_561784 [Mycena amicta]|nr:hypothetical protein C8F01DRAFT_561784 [Mycena amicta]